MYVRFFYALAVAASMSCASTAATTSTGTRRDANVITQQEIQAISASTAYDVISRLRPNFLRSRGRSTVNTAANDYAVVFLDSQRFGGLSSLRTITSDQIREIRFIPGTAAVTKYGMEYG